MNKNFNKRVQVFSLVILTGILSLFSGCQFGKKSNSDPTERPNILIINVDDLGFHDLSLYGSEIYETPNIDKLASEAYSFRKAYANYPRCLPSRYALMTATYPVDEFDVSLSPIKDANNFIKLFRENGYRSYYIGKWHLGEDENSPVGFGFDDSFAANGAGGVASHFYPFNTRKIVAPIGEVPPVEDVEKAGKEGDYLADLLTNELISYLKTQENSHPFFAMLNPYAVHTPFEAKEEDIARNEKQIAIHDFGNRPLFVEEGNGMAKMRQDDPVYAAMVENMDWNLGRILQTLEELGMAENTILVLTSDHGGLSVKGSFERRLATTNYPLRAGKGHLYEGGIRVPLMIRWPNRIKAQDDQQNIVALMDLMPTLLDLSGSGQMDDVDGRSFRNVMLGTENWSKRDLFFHEAMARPKMTGDFPCTAVISGNYKLMYFLEKDIYELYDLSKDIEERNNLIDSEPETASRLKSLLEEWEVSYNVKNSTESL